MLSLLIIGENISSVIPSLMIYHGISSKYCSLHFDAIVYLQ